MYLGRTLQRILLTPLTPCNSNTMHCYQLTASLLLVTAMVLHSTSGQAPHHNGEHGDVQRMHGIDLPLGRAFLKFSKSSNVSITRSHSSYSSYSVCVCVHIHIHTYVYYLRLHYVS